MPITGAWPDLKDVCTVIQWPHPASSPQRIKEHTLGLESRFQQQVCLEGPVDSPGLLCFFLMAVTVGRATGAEGFFLGLGFQSPQRTEVGSKVAIPEAQCSVCLGNP